MAENKEFNTVILAGLLHDMGKLYQRIIPSAENIYHGKHSRNFVEMFLEKKWENIGDFVDRDLLEQLVYYHHSQRITKEAKDVPAEIKDLMWLVSEADNLSAKEREQEEGYKLSKEEREFCLYSIFSKIGQVSYSDEKNFYKNSVLSPDIASNEEEFLGDTVKKFGLFEIKPKKFSFWQGYNFVYNILLKFASLIPDFTMAEFPDTSLFVHSSLCSAFAGCLYLYHKEKSSLEKSSIDDRDDKKFIIYKAGLSPIQKFLLEIERENPRHAAKILRGRSVLISLLSDAAAYSILWKLNLPVSNCVINAGTNFTLLLPNTSRAKEVIEEVEAEVKKFLLENLLAKVNYISYYITASANDISEKYNDIFKKIGKGFNEAKYRPYYDKEEMEKVSNRLYENAKLSGDNKFCGFCGLYWIDLEDKEEKTEENYCYICNWAKEIGAGLPKSKVVSFIPTEENNKSESRRAIAFMRIELCKDVPSEGAYVSYYYNLHGRGETLDNEKKLIGSSAVYHPISAYIPAFENTEDICSKCKAVDTCQIKEDKREENFLTLECIANADRELSGEEFMGDDLLAVLKADVDNLGKVINSLGEVELDDRTSRKAMTISRFYQFSFFLDYFFSAVLPYKLRQYYPFAYLVYAGGDDLLLIGPWRSVISLAKDMKKWFSEYVFDNPNITFSAGISFFRPKTPLKWAVSRADNALREAKNRKEENGGRSKNRLAININEDDGMFVFTWDEVAKKEGWFVERIENILTVSVKANVWGRGRLNRLLLLWRMAKRTLDSAKTSSVEDYLYASYFRYMLNRDFPENKKLDEEQKELVKKIEVDIGRYFSSSPPKEELGQLGLSIYMALIKTRR